MTHLFGFSLCGCKYHRVYVNMSACLLFQMISGVSRFRNCFIVTISSWFCLYIMHISMSNRRRQGFKSFAELVHRVHQPNPTIHQSKATPPAEDENGDTLRSIFRFGIINCMACLINHFFLICISLRSVSVFGDLGARLHECIYCTQNNRNHNSMSSEIIHHIQAPQFSTDPNSLQIRFHNIIHIQ